VGDRTARHAPELGHAAVRLEVDLGLHGLHRPRALAVAEILRGQLRVVVPVVRIKAASGDRMGVLAGRRDGRTIVPIKAEVFCVMERKATKRMSVRCGVAGVRTRSRAS
jgi:hypothetical protein